MQKLNVDKIEKWTLVEEDPSGALKLKIEKPHTVFFYAKQWKAPKQKAVMTFVHGIGEHISRYEDFFSALAKAGITVFAYDQRGFGRTVHLNNGTGEFSGVSGGRGMVVGDAGRYVEDTLADVYRAVMFSAIENVPHFLMGHSMGGLVVSNFVTSFDVESWGLDGIIVSAPGYRPGFHVPWLKRTIGSLLSRILGTVNIPTEIDSSTLSRDIKIIEAYNSDPYVHGMGSLRTLSAVLDQGDLMVTEGYKQWPKNVRSLMTFGTADKVTSIAAGKEVYEKIKADGKNIEFKEYEGFWHELHNEPEREQVYKNYANWILK